MLGLVLFFDVGGMRGCGECGPCPGDLAGIWWVIVRVQHHGLLRPAGICLVSAACAGQVDALLAGVPDKQALVECVARSRVVRLYEWVLLGRVASPGVVTVGGRICVRWFDVHRRALRRDKVISGLPCRLLTCGWPMRNLRRVGAAVRRRCTAGDRLRWAGHVCAASGGAGRSRRCCPACS